MLYIIQRSFSIFILLLVAAILTACGSSSDNPPTEGGTILKGIFIDSPVQGVAYATSTLSGITDENGTFQYQDGEEITFSIGGIILGTTMGSPLITPVQLVPRASDSSNPTVINIMRLLLTLDADNDPTNGINITAEIRSAAANMSLDFAVTTTAFATSATNPDLESLLTVASSTLVDVATAQDHFEITLTSRAAVWDSSNWGDAFWQ